MDERPVLSPLLSLPRRHISWPRRLCTSSADFFSGDVVPPSAAALIAASAFWLFSRRSRNHCSFSSAALSCSRRLSTISSLSPSSTASSPVLASSLTFCLVAASSALVVFRSLSAFTSLSRSFSSNSFPSCTSVRSASTSLSREILALSSGDSSAPVDSSASIMFSLLTTNSSSSVSDPPNVTSRCSVPVLWRLYMSLSLFIFSFSFSRLMVENISRSFSIFIRRSLFSKSTLVARALSRALPTFSAFHLRKFTISSSLNMSCLFLGASFDLCGLEEEDAMIGLSAVAFFAARSRSALCLSFASALFVSCSAALSSSSSSSSSSFSTEHMCSGM
mmetsp:Transcript_11017/g.21878  ORF Transcript_11017/g.21878 Transcript_11017/m.21878 type:complete len:334 (+) Transcript_11017:906-1907(+)